jgi:outer membrane immunogenic protein
MKNSLLACSALTLALFTNSFVGTVHAADPVVYETPVEAPAAISVWGGFYAGGHIGYGWGDATFSEEGEDPIDFDFDGIVGGVHVGYNWQVSHFVFGVEGDISATDFTSGPVGGNDRIVGMDWMATLRGRAGIAYNNWLFYGTAGVAWADLHAESTAGPNFRSGSESEAGWVAGLGLERKFTDRMSGRVEWLHSEFETNFDFPTFEGDTDFSVDTVRIGISFHF